MKFSPDPRYWGSKFWFVMHTVAEFYPQYPNTDDMANAKNFYTSLRHLLPCPSCAEHYSDLLLKYDIDNHLTSKDSLMRYVNMLHNEVNKRIGKPLVSYEQYLQNLFLPQENAPKFPIEYIMLGIILAILIILSVRMYQRHVSSSVQ